MTELQDSKHVGVGVEDCRRHLAATGISGLEELAAHAICYSVLRGGEVVRAGEPRRDRLFVVVSGRLRAELAGADGRTATLWWLSAGGVFDDVDAGRVDVVRQQPISLIAAEPVTVCSLPGASVRQLAQQNPAFALALVLDASRRLDAVVRAAEAMLFAGTEERYTAELRRRALSDGEILKDGWVKVQRLRDTEIARTIACSRETVCRLRAAMITSGLLREEGMRGLALAPSLLSEP